MMDEQKKAEERLAALEYALMWRKRRLQEDPEYDDKMREAGAALGLTYRF